VVGVVFAHNLEAGVVRYSDADGDHHLKDDAADLPALARVLALAQVDSSQWRDLIPFRTRESEKAERNCLSTFEIQKYWSRILINQVAPRRRPSDGGYDPDAFYS
jgi:hypothetical protein